MDLGPTTFQQQQQLRVDDDAASVASEYSEASTADVAGSLYSAHQHSPAALFMSPSASFGGDDGSAGYEPTMSPRAFQAAMAAGILAAQGVPAAGPKQEGNRVLQPAVSSQRNAAAAVYEHSEEAPVPSTVAAGAGRQDHPPTPSSVASNSAASMPAIRPDVSASFTSAEGASSCHGASATPTSKQTEEAGTAISKAAAVEAAEDPASPRAELSSNSLADSLSAALNASSLASSTDEADSCKHKEANLASAKHDPAQLLKTATSILPREVAQSQTADSHAAIEHEPASTQLFGIAGASTREDASELSAAAQPAADGAESAPPLPASHADKGADSRAAAAATNAVAAGHKGLFSAVSKRPAEVRNLTASSSPKLCLPGYGPSSNWNERICPCP